ncbi:MAG: biotin--[acetyl-CoA-carboxylase] ligase [Tissierellia bacterium]|nr:biotin--[acetyl-CoA-carboxylase] ligase [Tissierellia bacterium]
MKKSILKILKNNKDKFISGEKLSEEFDMTRSGIWKYIKMLKEEGYDIESVPNKGYRIVSSPDILTLEEIEENLNTSFIGRKIYYYDSINSTNDRAKEMAFEENEGTLVIAEEQTKGKGRLGRSWISPKGKGIWMSMILKPELGPINAGSITLLAAAAVHSALKNLDINSEIKWPNDLLIEGKKAVGILTEMSAELNRINYIVIGIGINVNLNEEDIPEDLKARATSIKITQNKKVDRKKLLSNILNEFEKLYIPFVREESTAHFLSICRENSATIGRKVKIIKNKEEKGAKALDINEKGELVVQYEDGKIENVFSGEVSVRGNKGYI